MGRPKKKRNKKEKNTYFGDKEESAVISYNLSTSDDERHAIYVVVLKKPIGMMAEIIYKRYHSTDNKGGIEIEEIIHNAITHVYENLYRYDQNRLTKDGKKTTAYKYFGSVIRNYYRDHAKISNKKMIKNLSYDDYFDQIESSGKFAYEIDVPDQHEINEKLINMITDKIKNRILYDNTLKKNEIIVGEAIVNVLLNWHCLFLEETNVGNYNKKISNNFAKNKILLFLKEQTNLSTKEIRSSMKQYKELYFFEKNEFFKEDS